MSNRRIPFHRFFPVLSAQLGMGASVPRLSPLAQNHRSGSSLPYQGRRWARALLNRTGRPHLAATASDFFMKGSRHAFVICCCGGRVAGRRCPG
jgi:hypothetical protein